jgi:hypothetical protein
VTTAPARNLQGIEAFLDHVPTALLLIEPGTGAVFFANQAAHALAGGCR